MAPVSLVDTVLRKQFLFQFLFYVLSLPIQLMQTFCYFLL
jgi:hypothetical protein